jgi:lipase chaperone LimK
MALLNTPPVQSNLQVQATIHAHIMEHLQMKADMIALEQMPPQVRNQFEQISQQAQQLGGQEGLNLNMQAKDLLAQFSAPILSELIVEFTEKIGPPSDEDPLVTIRKQELALKGQELAQEQQQFVADQNRRKNDALAKNRLDQDRINTQEDIAEMKDETTQQRLKQQKQLKMLDLMSKK